MRVYTGGRVAWWSTTGAAVALVLLPGCSGDSAEEPVGAPPASNPSAVEPSATGADGGAAVSTPSAPLSTSAGAEVPADPVATVPGLVDATVLEAYRLLRTGSTVTLTMAVLNEGAEPAVVGDGFNEGNVGFTASGISLLDPVGLDRYLVLRDTDDQCLCSSFAQHIEVEPGARTYFSASFPAPPAEVTTMTVETPSGSLPDVPITEGS